MGQVLQVLLCRPAPSSRGGSHQRLVKKPFLAKRCWQGEVVSWRGLGLPKGDGVCSGPEPHRRFVSHRVKPQDAQPSKMSNPKMPNPKMPNPKMDLGRRLTFQPLCSYLFTGAVKGFAQ